MKTPWIISSLLFCAAAVTSQVAQAQVPPPGAGWSPYPPSGQQQPWGQPPGAVPAPAPYAPPAASMQNSRSSEIEIGSLYGVSAAYGVGLGMWFDSETGLDDPGLQFIPPVVLGVAAPVGVYFLDDPPMDRGMPAAISAGLLIGAGEGLGIWAYEFTTANDTDAWGFRGLSRASALGSTLGGAAGYALGYFQEPDPETSVLLGSSAIWGGVIGSMIGYGSTSAGLDFGEANDGASLGGLIGYNLGLGAAAGISAFYVPSWENLGWMWVGGGIGAAAGLPIYLAYAGSDKPAKRGLIFQGITTGLGIAAAGIFTSESSDYELGARKNHNRGVASSSLFQLTGVGPMSVDGGAGVQLTGMLL